MSCYFHSDKDGQYKCCECGKTICEECAHTDGYKAVCKECYQALNVKNVNRNYGSFWGFIFSLIPGAGHMYLGFMERGLIIMLLFAGLITLTSTFFIGPVFAFGLVVLWFYCFFDTYHIKKQIRNNEIILDKPLLNFKIKLKSSYIAYACIAIGGLVLFNELMDNILREFLTWSQIYSIRNMLFPIVLIAVGVYILMRIRKSEAEPKDEDEIIE